MRQLELKFNPKPNHNIPDFREWLYRVNDERRLWKEKPYRIKEGLAKYNRLIDDGFTFPDWNKYEKGGEK